MRYGAASALERRGDPRAVGACADPSELPGDPDDGQSRYLEAAVNGVLVASIYAPNGNPQPGPKFDYKLAWLRRLAAHTADLYVSGAPVVLAGDYNVVPTDLDIYPTKSWDRDALLQPESRAAYQRLLSQGWTDAIRALHPKEPMFTFWDYKRNRWERDGGLRLDHILLNSALTERLQDAGVDRQTRGMEGASDHAPVWVKLRDAPNRRNVPIRRDGGRAAIAAATALPKAEKTVHRIGAKARGRGPAASAGEPPLSRRPLLVIDGELLRASIVPCLAENHSPERRQGRGRHPWLRKLPVALLHRRAASGGHCRLGQLGGADEAPRNVSRLPERATVRR